MEKKIDAETQAEALVINIPGLFGDENDGIDYQNVDMDELDTDLLLGRKTSDWSFDFSISGYLSNHFIILSSKGQTYFKFKIRVFEWGQL